MGVSTSTNHLKRHNFTLHTDYVPGQVMVTGGKYSLDGVLGTCFPRTDDSAKLKKFLVSGWLGPPSQPPASPVWLLLLAGPQLLISNHKRNGRQDKSHSEINVAREKKSTFTHFNFLLQDS